MSGEATTPAVNNTAEPIPAVNSEAKIEKAPHIQPVKASKVGSMGTLILIATIVALVGTGALYLYKTSRINRLETEKNRYLDLTSSLNSEELSTLSNDLQEIMDGKVALEAAFKDRIYWSKFWEKLNAATPKNITYSSLSIDSNNVVSVGGISNNLTNIAKLMVSLESAKLDDGEKLFSDVKLGSTSIKDDAGTSFAITFNVNSKGLK